MKLISFRIKNYKSIIDTGEIKILDPITILVGKNESGKSNIIEAFDFLTTSQTSFDNLDSSISLDGIKSRFNTTIIQETPKSINHFEFILNTELEKNEIENFFDSMKSERNITFILTIKNRKFKRVAKSKNEDNFDTDQKNIFSIKESTRRWDFFYKKIIVSLSPFYLKTMSDIEPQIKIPLKIPNSQTPINDNVILDLSKAWTVLLYFLCGKKFSELDDLNINLNEINFKQKNEILEKMDTILEEINLILKEAFFNDTELKDFPLAIEFHKDGRSWVTIGFIEGSENNKIFFGIDKRSTGAKSFLNIWIHIRFHLANFSDQQRIILLDEPDIHIHESLQIKFLKLLEKLAKKNCIVIFSTHSTVLPSYEKPERICIVERDKENGTTVKNWPLLKKEPDFEPHTINDVIGGATAYSIYSWTTKNNLIVEGATDELYLKAIKNAVIDLFDGVEKETLEQLNIIKAHGGFKAEPYVKILSSWGCKLVVLFDYDSGGYHGTNRLLKSEGLSDIKNKLIYTKALGMNQDFDDFWIEMEKGELSIENLFSESDRKKYKIFAKLKPEEKYVTARNFSNKKLELTEETKNNFKDLFQRILDRFKTNR